jgi:hypothetical protein
MRRSFVIEVILSVGIAQLGMEQMRGPSGTNSCRISDCDGFSALTTARQGFGRLACRRVAGISAFLLGVFALNIRRATNAKLLHPVDQ